MNSTPDLRICEVGEYDPTLLEHFQCAPDELPYQQEVETFIRHFANTWHENAEHEDRRMLALLDEVDTLIAIGAHRREMFYEDAETRLGRRIEFVAVDTAFHGVRSPDGERYSDTILQALLDDLLVREPVDPIVSAIIHRDNRRSLALFMRNDFNNVDSWEGEYLIVW